MCGISGIISKENIPINPSWLKQLNDAASHRGPDGYGEYFGKNFALAHRRLKILDLSENGKQPMSYEDLTITFNGEIYNYIEVKQELVKKNYSFKSTSDTEVILAAYKEWGTDCLAKFNGMWAFALFDASKNILFIARDRFGVKPLHYAWHNNHLLFSSEIKQILALKTVRKVDEYMFLQKLVCHLENHEARTFFKDILTLPPSHYMVYDLNRHAISINKYYSVSFRSEYSGLNLMDAQKLTHQLLQQSIHLRLRSDVAVGTCLSGGLDSSLVSALASAAYRTETNKQFIAINAKSIQKNRDESAYASQVASHLDLNIHYVEPTYSDFSENVDQLVYTQEEPFGSPSMFMGYFVFKKAKDVNCTVMLNGQGGDEVLLGYERYFVPLLHGLKGMEKARAAVNYYKNSRLNLIQTLLYILYFGSFQIRRKKLLTTSHAKKQFLDATDFGFIKTYADLSRNIFELQNFELSSIQLPKLLRYEDRNSMAHSIETRLPFLDYNVVEAALSIAGQHKIKDGWSKYVLRKIASEYLPGEISWRKNKFGFEAPEDIWLKMHQEKMVKEIKDSSLIDKFCNQKTLLKNFNFLSNWDKWLYYNIAVWERVFNIETL
jgi:asparagine synthase (glutamine-hydrolysing)